MSRKFLMITAIIGCGALLCAASPAFAQRPSLGSAENFAVLGASTVTSTGFTTVTGDLGVAPGTAVVGFPPGIITGTTYAGGAVALTAQGDVTAAYNLLAGTACTSTLTGTDLGGLTLGPGVYCFASSAPLNGVLTFDAQGDSEAVFIFKIGSTLLPALNSSILLINGARADYVFWQVGSSATLALNVDFSGNILALASITLSQQVTLSGRALARTGAVTMNASEVTMPTVIVNPGGDFIRGDCNANLLVDLADPIFLLDLLFLSGTSAQCSSACDANDNGALTITDAIVILNRMFAGGAPLAAPSISCGPDPTVDSLGCASYPCP